MIRPWKLTTLGILLAASYAAMLIFILVLRVSKL